MSGPLATRNMTAFTLKLTTALHFEATGSELPPQAGICARWFSNYDRLTGVFPATIFDDWPPARALEQGKKTTIGQFEYVSRVSSDHSIGAHLATFRFSLAVVGFVAYDKATLLNSGSDFDPQVFSPTELGELLKNLKTS